MPDLATLDPTPAPPEPPVNKAWIFSQTGIGSIIGLVGTVLCFVPGVPQGLGQALVAFGATLAVKGLRDASIRNGSTPTP